MHWLRIRSIHVHVTLTIHCYMYKHILILYISICIRWILKFFISCTDIGNNCYCWWIAWGSEGECWSEALLRQVGYWAGPQVRRDGPDCDMPHSAADSIALWRRLWGDRLALPAGVHIGAATGAANTRTGGGITADCTGQSAVIWVNIQ